MTKWYWPTWADWLQVYKKQPVVNLAYQGFGTGNIYFTLLEQLDQITPEDTVIIMWAQSNKLAQWYDEEWVRGHDCWDFFPKTGGQLWFTQDHAYRGMYHVHPDHAPSFTHNIVDNLQCILHTQHLLERTRCDYVMTMVQNFWNDTRPVHRPTFSLKWPSHAATLTPQEIGTAHEILRLDPVRRLINMIDWTKFSPGPRDPFDPTSFMGIWEFNLQNREYITLQHDTDCHPNPLAHHDFMMQHIMRQSPESGRYRSAAKEMALSTIDMMIPEFTNHTRMANAKDQVLNETLQKKLMSLYDH